jgi:flavin reductase (DIM6/NTAB) family NADH-FMN oxidoreductase RutF
MSLRKKPWNRISLPVYSICSSDDYGHFNMNICTYVSAVSMQPKRIMVAVYHNTKTFQNLQSKDHFVLQVLSAGQYSLVRLLGKTSGKQVDKIKKLENKHELITWNGFPVLKNCLAVMELKTIRQMDAGDHTMLLCDVRSYKNLQEGKELTTTLLKEHRIITA